MILPMGAFIFNAHNNAEQNGLKAQSPDVAEQQASNCDLSHVLKCQISDWLKQKRRRRLTSLSRLSGVPYATLKRLESGKNKPNMETVVGIISVINSKEQQEAMLSRYYPKLFDIFLQWRQSLSL